MTRLGVLPIEIETSRWQGLARDQRRCSLGSDHVGDTEHLLSECTQIAAKRICSLNQYAKIHVEAANQLRHWRDTARRLECRWRERTRKLRCSTAEPQHPADAQDNEFATEIDDVDGRDEKLRADDIRFYGTAR